MHTRYEQRRRVGVAQIVKANPMQAGPMAAAHDWRSFRAEHDRESVLRRTPRGWSSELWKWDVAERTRALVRSAPFDDVYKPLVLAIDALGCVGGLTSADVRELVSN